MFQILQPIMAFDILSNPLVCLSLSELNDLEERLVALRIPFMQIRELGQDRQYGIKESVTNVPNDLHKSVDCLPRNVNDSATIYVKLKKRLSFKSHFMYKCVNPNQYNAALY
ncbi:ATP-dependent DNA helicase [Caerostris darwini]|uniref:ATP-dependent DNA helicase n=1 Tax=Caerostris darwini TaxID=1538125 RepID=A0AAV4UC54_9ARAC|nr:ATP-dependent DNA helicase [Caerostris darwini]